MENKKHSVGVIKMWMGRAWFTLGLVALIGGVLAAPALAVRIQPEAPDGKTMSMGNFLIPEASPIGGELDFDVIYRTGNPVWIAIDITDEDVSFFSQPGDISVPTVAFSANFVNLFEVPLSDLEISFRGEEGLPDPTIARVGDASSSAGGFELIGGAGDSDVMLSFSSPLVDDRDKFTLGVPGTDDPFEPNDWFIDVTGYSPGDTFNVHIVPNAVPEPLTATLGIMGLVAVGFHLLRRPS